MLVWSFDSQHIVTGVLISALVSFMTAGLFKGHEGSFKNPARYLWIFYYIPVFIWECLKANIDGALRVIHPGAPINPGIVKVRTELKSDIALTLLANSLTLTPGTMVVDIDKENGFLYVHWVNVKTQDVAEATELIVSRFERILKRIF